MRRSLLIPVAAGLLLASVAVLTGAAAVAARPGTTPLRVCADPNNLPFSNARGEGFENRLALMAARDLGTRVSYTWWAQRRGFLRHTLDRGDCDVVFGVPARLHGTETTRPYYRSTYVFVSPRRRNLRVQSLDDPALRRIRIGVQMVGDDFSNSPPAHALARRGVVSNVVGYSVLGDYAEPNPPARIVEAVARGEIDAAFVWGPQAGYFASRQPEALDIAPILSGADPDLPFTFDIAIAVRRGDARLKRVLDDFIVRRRAEIDRVLAEYHVPRVGGAASAAGGM